MRNTSIVYILNVFGPLLMDSLNKLVIPDIRCCRSRVGVSHGTRLMI